MIEQRPVEPLEAHPRLVEHDREEEPSANEKRTTESGEDERPDEDAQERLADQRVVDDG